MTESMEKVIHLIERLGIFCSQNGKSENQKWVYGRKEACSIF